MNFETGQDGIDRATDQVMALFDVTIERHDRQRFQTQGHFVPGMVDENGFRREWDGPNVYVGVLWCEIKDVSGNVTDKSQVLRVLADSPHEVQRIMSQNVKSTFFALHLAQQQQANVYELYRRATDEHVEFVRELRESLPVDAESLSTATLGRMLARRLADVEFALKASDDSRRACIEDAQRKITALTKALPWWTRKRIGA